MLTFDDMWHVGEVVSTDDSRFSLFRTWVSGLLMSMLWIEWPIVAVVLWYRQAYSMLWVTNTGTFY